MGVEIRHARRRRRLATVLATLLAAGALSLGSLPTAFADFVATAATQTQRMTEPHLNSRQEGWYNAGDRLTLVCSVRGQAVQGHFSFNIPGGWDNLWYRTSDGHYVADVDIETGTLDVVAPDCGTVGQTAQPPNDTPPPARLSQSVQGQIACTNAEPVGVWIQAETSKSGWAAVVKPNPAREGATALWKLNFSYNLDNGGRYQVHVGCGTKLFSADWANNVKSDYVEGSRDFICNDMNMIQDVAWRAIRSRIFGAFGRAVDPSRGAPPFGRCDPV